MCGIFGQLKRQDFALEKARQALHTLTHRGPDQWGDWQDDHVYSGHRRLSILDLSEAGRQPMVAGGVVLSANGEIWNYQALRTALEGEGYRFTSHSDSEVLLHGYRAWGWDALLKRIDGMYAFSLYDSGAGKLYLARDRFGIKPLYYAAGAFGFAYASEVKALFAWEDQLRCFSLSGVRDWLLYRGSESGLTPYHQVKRLLPGHALSIDVRGGAVAVSRYYDVLDTLGGQASDPAELPARFEAAVQKRLMADVPIGLQLSGGVDSSLVGHAMHRLYDAAQINSFSVGFDAPGEAHLSEEPYARYVADQFGFTHHQFNIDRHAVAQAFEHVVWLADGMLDFPNTIPIYLLSRYAKDFVTVQLTGEGADELFAGYTKFRRMAALEKAGKAWHLLPRGVAGLAGRFDARIGRALFLRQAYAGREGQILNNLNSYISRQAVEELFGAHEPALLAETTQQKMRGLSFKRQLIIADHKTYLSAVLERQDKASMGAGLESRVPFLDRDLIEWAMNLDEACLFGADETKKLVKDYATQAFTHEFAYRKKVGFPLPLQRWMAAEDGLKPWLDKVQGSDFVLHDYVQRYRKRGFDHVLLHYGDRESQWVDYFLMVLRAAQEVFGITEVKDDEA